jgi:5-methylcytosine-specific restriction endonuclease McrA
MGLVRSRRHPGRWAAKLTHHGRQVWLGTYESRTEAQDVLERAREQRRVHGAGWELFLPSRSMEADYRDALLSEPCAYCGAPSTQIDHIDPRFHGGMDDWTNFAGACRRCNHEKAALSMLGFLIVRRLQLEITARRFEIKKWREKAAGATA